MPHAGGYLTSTEAGPSLIFSRTREHTVDSPDFPTGPGCSKSRFISAPPPVVQSRYMNCQPPQPSVPRLRWTLTGTRLFRPNTWLIALIVIQVTSIAAQSFIGSDSAYNECMTSRRARESRAHHLCEAGRMSPPPQAMTYLGPSSPQFYHLPLAVLGLAVFWTLLPE